MALAEAMCLQAIIKAREEVTAHGVNDTSKAADWQCEERC